MIVIRLENAPASLRGDLTKWLLEIDAGVYVGRVSARVRDRLWDRITDNVKNGRALMVYSAKNEQGLAFKVHGAVWEPIDFDGVRLIMRPSPARLKERQTGYRPGTSRQARLMRSAAAARARARGPAEEGGGAVPEKPAAPREYAVIDVETTGLDDERDEILEYGAIKIVDGEKAGEYNVIVRTEGPIPPKITELTGITRAEADRRGVEPEAALAGFLDFVGDLPCVAHNAGFDYGFIRAACARHKRKLFMNRQHDTLAMARRALPALKDRKLATLAAHFGVEGGGEHRGLRDCEVTNAVFVRLLELEK
jgi:CRISPR-associated protein Cas2